MQDNQSRPIPVPPDKRQRMDELDQIAIFFLVQQDKQSMPVPAALAQHQGLSEEQMDAVCISTVLAVPVTQEKIGGRMSTTQYPTHVPPRPTRDKKVRWIKWTQNNRPDDNTYSVHLDRMEVCGQTLPTIQEDEWESDNLCEMDMEGEGEEAEPPTPFAYPGADDTAHMHNQQMQQTAPQPQAALFMQAMQADLTTQAQPQHIVVQDTDQQVGMQQLGTQQPTVQVVQQPQAQPVLAHLQLDQVIRQIPDSFTQKTIFTTPIPTTSQSVRARTLTYAPMQPLIDARAASGGTG